METASENVTDEIQEIVPEKHCLETENMKDGSNDGDDEIGVANLNPKKRRIIYAKEFLLECFRHPACSRKPKFFFPNLECELSTARLKGTPLTTVYVTPRKKDENRRKFPEDNISLRPHSGNFSSGCAPNLSPAHFPQNQFNRFQFQHDEAPKNLYDRGFSRSNYRFSSNVRQDLTERNRVGDRDRDRERELRDRDRERERDRDNRENRNNRNQIQNPARRQNAILWGPEAENQPEWTRRRTGYSDNKDGRNRTSSYNSDRPNHRHYREYEEELEPEWFSGGPKSQHETIELHGFDDDGRRDSSSARDKVDSHVQGLSCGSNEATNGSSTNESIHEEEVRSDEPNDMVLSIEKILKIDHIPGILPNGLFEDVEPAGSSRFSQFFQRNSSTTAPHEEIQTRAEPRADKTGGEGGLLQALFGSKSDANASPLESKSDVVKVMETELRQILLRNNGKEEAPEHPKEPPKQEDLNAFKKLLEDLVIKSNKTVQPKMEVPAQDKGNGPAVTGPPPGLHGMPFNPFALLQQRPLQPHNSGAPPMLVNPMMMNPLSRLVEQQQHLQQQQQHHQQQQQLHQQQHQQQQQQHQQQLDQAVAAQNQKRSGTPVTLPPSFTPTAVMRKMTADQQTKTGASAMNENITITTYNGIPRQPIPQGPFPPGNVNVNVLQQNSLSSIMSAMANQSQHMPPPQQQQMPPHPGHPHMHPHPHQPHVSLPPGGFHPSRVQFPVMVGPPNPTQFPPFMMYGPHVPVPQRK